MERFYFNFRRFTLKVSMRHYFILLLCAAGFIFLSGFTKPVITEENARIYDEMEFATAVKEFEKILQLEPGNKKAQQILELLKKKQDEKKNAQLYFDKGMMEFRAGKFSAALTEFRNAMKYDPGNPMINAKIEKCRENIVGTKRFSLKFKKEAMRDILMVLAQEAGVNILIPDSMKLKINIEFTNLTFEDALTEVLKETGYSYEMKEDFIKIVEVEQKTVTEGFAKEEKLYNTSFKDFSFKDVIETMGKMMKINVIMDDSVSDISDKKVNLYIQEMKLWNAFQLILKMFDVTYSKFNEFTYIIMSKDRLINSGYNEESKNHMFFPITNVDPTYIIDLISKTPGFKNKINSKDLVVISREGKGIKESTRISGILVYETPENLASLKELINQIDIKRKQVIISVRMMEISRVITQKLGLDIDFNPTGANDSDYDKIIDPKIFQHFKAKLINRGGTAVSTDKLVLSSTLDFLEKQDMTKTIASPSIRTLDGEKASINIVSAKPVQYAKPITATNAQGQPVIEITYDWQTINYGIKLDVEPVIHEDDEITLKLNISKDAPGVKVDGLDSTFRYESTSNTIDTLVRIKDGETVIMGGLISKQRDVNQKTVPFFNRIPVIGKLFDHKEVSDPENKELVIFITPYLVNNSPRGDDVETDSRKNHLKDQYTKIMNEIQSDMQ